MIYIQGFIKGILIMCILFTQWMHDSLIPHNAFHVKLLRKKNKLSFGLKNVLILQNAFYIKLVTFSTPRAIPSKNSSGNL